MIFYYSITILSTNIFIMHLNYFIYLTFSQYLLFTQQSNSFIIIMTEAKLRNRIKVLEEDLASKNDTLLKYQTMGSAADDKIQALSKIHNDKIRLLMNSIQMLKKDNAQLTNQGKQHKRSQLIAGLNKQISDQDIVIQVIRNYVYKKEGKEQGRAHLDTLIVTALTKGPERIRAPTRQQLKIEIENLKVRLQQTKLGNAKQMEVQDKEVISNSSEISNVTIENDRQQLFKTLQFLKTSNQKLNLQIKSSVKTIDSLKSQLSQNGKLQVQITSLSSELAIANKKVQTLQSLLKQTKQYNNNKILELYQRQIKVQELELESKTNNNKLTQLQQSHNMALQEMTLQVQRLKAEINALTKQNQRMIMENIGMKKTQDHQKGKIEEIRDINNKQKNELGDKLLKYQKQFERLVYDNDQKNQKIIILNEQIKAEKILITQLKVELEELRQNGASNEDLQALVLKNQQLQEQIQRLKQLGGQGGISIQSSLLMDRIRTLEKRISILQKQLKDGRMLSDKQIQALHDQSLFNKYIQLAKEFQTYKLTNKLVKPKKYTQKIYLDEQQKQKLKKIDTSISNLGLKSLQSNALMNFDSDFEYEIITKDKKKPGLPIITEYDRQLMKLITSDLWEFIEEDRVGRLLEDMSNYNSDYPQQAESEIQDDDWNNNFKQLQDIGKKMKKGVPVKVYAGELKRLKELDSDVSDVQELRERDLQKAFDSDIQLQPKNMHLKSIIDKNKPSMDLNSKDLGRIENISSSLSSSIMNVSVSQPESGESNINIFKKRQASKDKRGKQKTSLLIDRFSNLPSQNSDYEEQDIVKRRLGLNGSMNSSVNSGDINNSQLNLISSDLSVGTFKKK